jgi:hypothetical protein
MRKYITMQNLFVHWNIPNNPMKYWFDGFGWEMANCMCEQFLKIIQTIVAKESFFFFELQLLLLIVNPSFLYMCIWCMHGK